MIVRTDFPIPVLTVVRFRLRDSATPLDPTDMQDYPLPDGVTLSSSQDGRVKVGCEQGKKYEVPEASFSLGHLYAGAGGKVTQDFSAARATGWILCIGMAVSRTEFIYSPHAPSKVIL